MQLIWDLFLLALGSAGLYFGADFLVKGSVSVARRLGVPPLIIGLTLVACGTSAPELVVSLDAAWSGNADISLGNVVGSNICNIALILGLCGLLRPLAVQKNIFRFDGPVMIGSAVLLTVFYFFHYGLSRVQGIILLLLYAAYLWQSIRIARREGASQDSDEEKTSAMLPAILFAAGGFAALVAGAKAFLAGAVDLASMLGLSDAVIGLTVVAVGTSLPELATSVVASVKGENYIAIGNVIGSNIFNILAILGMSAVIAPMSNAALNWVDLGAMLLLSLLLLPVMRTQWTISRREGGFFLLLYIGYTTYLLMQHS